MIEYQRNFWYGEGHMEEQNQELITILTGIFSPNVLVAVTVTIALIWCTILYRSNRKLTLKNKELARKNKTLSTELIKRITT
tara:strand:- start:116 stop:361 length:246 start_codon:yes stop_codon:yes gene_type:complete